MPRAAAIIAASGGQPGLGYVPLAHRRIDVRSYGKTPLGAMKLHLAVHAVLKNLRRTPSLGVLWHSAALDAGPVAMREPEDYAERGYAAAIGLEPAAVRMPLHMRAAAHGGLIGNL